MLYLDTETYSPIPISSGVAVYAEEVEILLVTYAWDDEPTQIIEHPSREDLQGLIDCADKIVIHNAQFDVTVMSAVGVVIDPDKVHCTMAQALAHGLPGGLGMLCEIFKLKQAKDAAGKSLINLFCVPQKGGRRASSATHLAEWRRFCVYAMQDINALRELHRKLPSWNWAPKPHHDERAIFALDQRMNARGVCIDTHLAECAVDHVNDASDEIERRAHELTGGRLANLRRRDEVLLAAFVAYGVHLPDLKSSTLERRLADDTLPEELRELLRLRLLATTASVAKYRALLRSVSVDGRLRNTLQYCGASRTGRWAGRTFQPQNLPRTPDHFDGPAQEAAIERLKQHHPGVPPEQIIEEASWCLRGAIIADPDACNFGYIIAADLSNIEGRVAAWISGEQWKLDAFAAFDRGEGHDLYKITAGRILDKPPGEVTKAERQVEGKVSELALGYQGAVGAFRAMAAAYGLDVPEEQVVTIVKQWRKANPKITAMWYALEDAVRSTLASGASMSVGPIDIERWRGWLKIHLPSGRVLSYARPGLGPDGVTYYGVNQFSRKWEQLQTYGGKLFENICQATARDILAAGMLDADREGLNPVLSVHDEIICEIRLDYGWEDDGRPMEPDEIVAKLVECMTRQRGWMDKHMPLAASGFAAHRYRK